jgi:hypothetical protein
MNKPFKNNILNLLQWQGAKRLSTNNRQRIRHNAQTLAKKAKKQI